MHNLNVDDDDDHYDKTPSPSHTFNINSNRFTQTTSIQKCRIRSHPVYMENPMIKKAT